MFQNINIPEEIVTSDLDDEGVVLAGKLLTVISLMEIRFLLTLFFIGLF